MPEILEVEAYRRLAERVTGRSAVTVEAPDEWFVKGGPAGAVIDAVTGARIVGTRRRGKLLMLDLDGLRPTLGLRFGMTGRLVVDGIAALEHLEYGSARDEPAWVRLRLGFDDGGELVLIDPRRLGAIELDPDTAVLGPDAWTLDRPTLRHVLRGSVAPLKARLMDQGRIAGLGNLLTDEILWRTGLDPARPAGSLGPRVADRLADTIGPTLDELDGRGGSHTGDLQAHRYRGGRCPRDGTPLERRTVGGRTTYSCPRHQR